MINNHLSFYTKAQFQIYLKISQFFFTNSLPQNLPFPSPPNSQTKPEIIEKDLEINELDGSMVFDRTL